MTSAVKALRLNSGVRICGIRLNLLPILSGYVHLIFANGVIALIDICSGFGDDNDRIEAGMAEVRSEYWEIINSKWFYLERDLSVHLILPNIILGRMDRLSEGVSHVLI